MRLSATLAALLCLAATSAAAQERAPWWAAIGLLSNTAMDLSCSAILVRPDVVATAAHCVADADADDLLFAPALGDDVWRGVEILASGGFEGGPKINPAHVKSDWALIRIAPTGIAPAPVAALKQWEIRRAMGEGARLVAFGVDREGKLHVYAGCPLQSEHGDSFFKLRCEVKPGDSGGPVLLADGAGARLIGLLIGVDNGETIAVNARRFAPLLDGLEGFETRALLAEGAPAPTPPANPLAPARNFSEGE